MTDQTPPIAVEREAATKFATITVEGSNVEFPVEAGETVFAAAARNGYIWPTVCGGRADCSRCCMTVLEGSDNLSHMEFAERATLQRLRWAHGVEDPRDRLACQTRLNGDAVVHRRSVRRRPAEEVG
ncbi:(2Fe-2S)-binding protein [Microbacterium sp. zg.B48]|uniref:(2Fe-2S)-binding protein n=1 Tax=Microbacterium sp. zg.B48 TaxID=2969408 RepID=UPI00214B79F0|nr:(2Fe-2S)-binding protein [Microbacterium sp. zg.B48]MCR2764329.1 (2Fe-2S)-binding protein [Microbacterium sp. zg.B48]